MFSQTSVILSTGGVHGRGCDDRGSMHGRGCVAGGMCGGGGHAWQECAWQEACMAGACVAGVCMASGCVWQGGMHGLGACVAGEMATAADGMHRTGIHSCLMKFTHYSKGLSS